MPPRINRPARFPGAAPRRQSPVHPASPAGHRVRLGGAGFDFSGISHKPFIVNILEPHRPAIARLCRRHGVSELHAFGSVLRGDFGPDSDVDLLVVFQRDASTNAFLACREGNAPSLPPPLIRSLRDGIAGWDRILGGGVPAPTYLF
jgi:hypothetical protein